MKNKIIVAGGSGFMGISLIREWKDSSAEFIVLSRKKNEKITVDGKKVAVVYWDGKTVGEWKNELNNAALLINLSGRTVDCRYTEKNKKAILDSRIDSTRALGEAIKQVENPPVVWMNAASATIYRHAEDRAMDEHSGEIGSGFSVEVCKAWEKEFYSHQQKNVRQIALRTTMVMGKNGGVFPVLSKLSRFLLGGTMGNGKQYISWIHELDFVRSVEFLLQNTSCEGAYNIAAPNPEPNKAFMKALRKELKIPFGIPQPKLLLKIGAFFIRTETELVLKSRRVIPTKLVEAGFTFQFPDIESCFRDLNEKN